MGSLAYNIVLYGFFVSYPLLLGKPAKLLHCAILVFILFYFIFSVSYFCTIPCITSLTAFVMHYCLYLLIVIYLLKHLQPL